jgi:hypothetical protein
VPSYFDLAAANDRLADLRPLLASLRRDRDAVALAQLRLAELASAEGDHDGLVREERRSLKETVARMETAVRRIDDWGIALRDIGSGLVDFPALANGRPIWLCWKLGEGDIAWWHELQAGVAGRRPLIELE